MRHDPQWGVASCNQIAEVGHDVVETRHILKGTDRRSFAVLALITDVPSILRRNRTPAFGVPARACRVRHVLDARDFSLER
jgi:hypothetical protein